MNAEPGHREGIEQGLQQIPDALGIHGLTVENHAVNAIAFVQALFQLPGCRRTGLPAVDHHQKGLSGGLHILNGPALGGHIVLSGNVRDGSVGGHHQAQGGVAGHDLFGAQLRGLRHGDLHVIPGGGHHPGLPVLLRANRPGNHIANGIDHADPELGNPVGADFHGLLRHELGFRGHNGLAGAALGQLIPCPLRPEGIPHCRNHQFLHDPFDQCGFPGPNRPHHTDIDIPAGSGGNIRVNTFHSQPPHPAGAGSCHGLSHGMSPGKEIEPALLFLFSRFLSIPEESEGKREIF